MRSGCKPLSKRGSIWESPFALPNYTRPQGWQISDPGGSINVNSDDLIEIVSQMLLKEFGGITLDANSMEECVAFISKVSGSGYGLSYNRTKRILGLWLTRYHSPKQNDYQEGYRSLSVY